MCRRPDDKSSGGQWEFPGGKLDAGETAAGALVREIAEEVGVAIESATPWLTYHHAYADKIVRLQLFRVTSWRGKACGREGQRIAWQDPADLTVAPVMAAYDRAIAALRLPDVLALVHAGDGGGNLPDRVGQALAAGLRLVVLCSRGAVPDQFAQAARRVSELTRRHGARLLIAGAGAQTAQAVADGVHVPSGRLAALLVPPVTPFWSASCRNLDDLNRAAALGAAFATIPVPALAEPSDAGFDWPAFQQLIQQSALPVFAAGGVAFGDLRAARQAGAHGIALSPPAL